MVAKEFDLTKINTFPKLLDYLRLKLDWPIKDENLDDLTFEYSPDELGITDEHHININGIQQLRPLSNNQPWGIFFIDFESKKLPIVLLRRLLSALVPKNRASSQSSSQPTWNLDDLLFVSLLGEEKNRQVCFSHFKETEKGLPVLQTFSWDETETHLYYLKKFNLESLRWPGDVNNSDEWKSDWSSAFTASHGQVIKNSKELSVELAKIAKSIRHTVNEIYKYETDNGHYHKLLGMFKEALIHDLEPDDFSDMVAQTVTYGLFSAATTGKKLTGLSNLSDLIPNTNPFLKNLFDELTTISTTKQNVNFDELGLNDLFVILNETNVDTILQQFGRQTGGGSEDPVIHFYENFLEEYDKQMKVHNGVFYTPKPVVSFIVRSVHEMIIKEFNLRDGLADTSTWADVINNNPQNPNIKVPVGTSPNTPFINILDPAVGTGTFLVEVIDVIYKTMVKKWNKAGKSVQEINDEWNKYVNDHLLPRINGFELMMAPYSICHIKLGLKLKETGFDLANTKERFKIFLTNTLEDPEPMQLSLEKQFLAMEAHEANSVKTKSAITIIIGNPPYSISSQNKSDWIESLMKTYKKGLNEKNIQPLSDDYIKFIRYSQNMIEKNGVGISSYITNNSFVDGVIHTAMRKAIHNCYNRIFLFDLHGSTKRKEVCADGSPDKNVFDIQPGVSISLFIKSSNSENKISTFNLLGSRQEKYNFCLDNTISTITWKEFEIDQHWHLFKYIKKEIMDNYFLFPNITKVMPFQSSGIKTHNDDVLTNYSKSELRKKINNNYNIKSFNHELIQDYSYRPFDKKFIYYDTKLLGRAREKTIYHMKYENVALIIVRQSQAINTQYFDAAFITNNLTDTNMFRRGGPLLFPIYLFPQLDESQMFDKEQAMEVNLNKDFTSQLADLLGLNFEAKTNETDKAISPVDIIDYIYSILYSNNYRNTYKELLEIDFPRIPFTNNNNLFCNLINFGRELRAIHLLEDQKVNQFITTYPIHGNNTVVKPEYNEGRVFINNDQYFDGAPEIAWNFYIGGYQPAQKWLKDRKGRKLTTEDIEHYQKIIVALTETDKIMKEIDKVYPEVEKDLIEFKLDDLEKKGEQKSKPEENQKIFDLINKGEGQKIEFKATLQQSLNNPDIPNHVIENMVIKSIVGFCNTEGGNLLIGVNDDKKCIGIEADAFQDTDKFKNHLKNILGGRVEQDVFSFIKTESFKIEGKTICLIECEKSDIALFVQYEGVTHFYKRNLESTDSLNPQETLEYCKKRFK